LFTGKFHEKLRETSGRATVDQEADGKLVLRLTGLKTSNEPDVHAILVATKDASDGANFLKSSTESGIREAEGATKGTKITNYQLGQI
jgi:hypothetical protein